MAHGETLIEMVDRIMGPQPTNATIAALRRYIELLEADNSALRARQGSPAWYERKQVPTLTTNGSALAPVSSRMTT